MTDLECIVYGLIGTAVMEQAMEERSAFLEGHDWWVVLIHRGICRRWKCESVLGPPGARSTYRLS